MNTHVIVNQTADLINSVALSIARHGLAATEEACKASGAFCYAQWCYLRDRALLLMN